MIVIADVFPKLRAAKNLLRSISKKTRFREPFERQNGKGTSSLLKFERQHLHQIYWSMWRQLTYKKSLLVIYKIFRMFVNTLSADGQYSVLNRQNLTQPIQMQLSGKQKFFSEHFCAFLKPSPDLLINVKAFELKKVSVIEIQNLQTCI